MSANTTIEWCDHSWSPWRGCTKVSPGCANCYAETLSKINPAVLGQWGMGKPRVLAKNWAEPVKWDREASIPPVSREQAQAMRRPTVFPSLCDWLDDEVDSVWLYDFIKLIIRTPNLRWLLLTKRPENFVSRLRAAQASCTVDPLDIVDRIDAWISGDRVPFNVWVGTSIEDQTRADQRIPALLQIPAVGRFLSVEPLLGPVKLDGWVSHPDGDCVVNPLTGYVTSDGCYPPWTDDARRIHWVIIGGESGRGARPCHVEWIRSLVGQCKGACVPVFVKQLGAKPVRSMNDEPFERITRRRGNGDEIEAALPYHPKGGDPAEWPEDLRVREFPEGLR